MKKAIIIQNKFIGDVLVASMIAENLKKIYPNIQVHFFCFKPAKVILENNPNIDKVIAFEDNELKKLTILWQFAKEIRTQRYDILIDSYAKLQSRFITLFSGSKYRVSYNKPFFKYFYTHTYKKHQAPMGKAFCTAVDDRLMLLSPFVKNFKNLPIHKPNIYLSSQEVLAAKNKLINHGIEFNRPLFMIGILGSSKDKTWPLEYMVQLIDYLTEYFDFDLIFNYMPSQQETVDFILNQIVNQQNIYPKVLGKTVREFAAILTHCSGIIANEGGAINTAKALDVPSFSIYSPHKFRENWGCYEQENQHQSVHLQDFKPEIYEQYALKEILSKPKSFYLQLLPNVVIASLNRFLINNQFQPKKDLELEALNPAQPKISVLLITKNEQENMPTFLHDFSFADEIVIVDSKSTDNTKSIAQKNPKVRFIERDFDNFSSQKNYAIAQAKNEWILFFDADERLTIRLKNEILATVKNPNALDAYYIYRSFYFKNNRIRFSGWQNDKAIRLFKKSKNKYDTKKMVHETIVCQGSIGHLKNRLLHFSFSNQKEYERKLRLYSKLKAKQLHKEGLRPSWFHFYIKPGFRFLHHYLFGLGFLDGKNGWMIAKMHGKSVKQRYDFLQELIKQSN